MYDCVIVGGGIAGLQAAIQLGRYQRRVAVVDRGRGRSNLCRSYRNVLGWPDGIEGPKLREIGRAQAHALGVELAQAEIVSAEPLDDKAGFRLHAADGGVWEGAKLLLATGITDRLPDIPGLRPCLGLTVYVCPDCDGYETIGRKTVVLGSGDAGAGMALMLTYFTDRLILINHEGREITSAKQEQLRQAGIPVINDRVQEIVTQGDGRFAGVRLANGDRVEADRGFVGFGGNQVHAGLARQLGVRLHENGHILTDPRTKETSVPGIWAAGDVGVHSEQLTIAMGEGAQAAIWIHKALLREGITRSHARHP